MRTLAILVALAGTASADVTVTVNLNDRGTALAQSHGMTAAQLATRIRERVDALYKTAQVGSYLADFTDTTAFSARGLGVDYASLPESFVIGFAGTATVTASDATIAGENVLTRGLSANFGVMAGMNLGEWRHPRWTVYANGFYRDASTDEFSGAITSGGAHVQVKVIEPQESHTALRWIGLDVTTGLELTHWSFASRAPITNEIAIDPSTRATVATMGPMDLHSTAATIPVEASTGMRIASFLALYVGGAVDLSAGDSTVHADLAGDVRTPDDQPLGTVRIMGTESNTETFAGIRALAGAQLELYKFKLFVQLNAAPSVASVGAGFRVVL